MPLVFDAASLVVIGASNDLLASMNLICLFSPEMFTFSGQAESFLTDLSYIPEVSVSDWTGFAGAFLQVCF